MAIDWTRGYSCRWRVYEVKQDTWADGPMIAQADASANSSFATVERSLEGDAPLIESGSLRIIQDIGETWNERYARIAMIADQNGELERSNIATLLFSTNTGDIAFSANTLRAVGYSVLYPASVARIDIGSYAPAGADGAALAGRLLRQVIKAPVVVEGSFILSSHVVYDIGESILSIVWKLLRAGKFTIRISGLGVVHIGPERDTPSLLLDQEHARILRETTVPHDMDTSDIPNHYVAIDGSEIGEAINDDIRSIVSVPYRGYRYDKIDTYPIRIGGETLTAYCRRKLEEESVAQNTYELTREWWPDVCVGDIIRTSLASLDMEGDFRIVKQTLTCHYGVTVEEQVRKDVHLWPIR